MTTKEDLKKSWDELSRFALQHKNAEDKFSLLSEEYYGVEWHQLPPIADNDRIIDTIDYATDELSFKKFDELVLDAIKETKVNKS
jgi:hypothetical protein